MRRLYVCLHVGVLRHRLHVLAVVVEGGKLAWVVLLLRRAFRRHGRIGMELVVELALSLFSEHLLLLPYRLDLVNEFAPTGEAF